MGSEVINNNEQPTSNPKTLAELLKEPETAPTENPPEKAPPVDAPEKGKKAKPPKSLKALAETLKLEDKDLYAIEVPMANGESRTLGQLKDLVGKQDEFTVREFEFEENKTRREAEFTRAQRELAILLSAIPEKALNKDVLAKVAKKFEDELVRAKQAAKEAIPEWADDNKETEEKAAIGKWLEDYDLPSNFLNSVTDHRLLKVLRDSWRRKERADKALAEIKQMKPSATQASKPNPKAPRKQPDSPEVSPRSKPQPNSGLRALLQTTTGD